LRKNAGWLPSIQWPTNCRIHPTTNIASAHRQLKKKSGKLKTIIGMPMLCVRRLSGCLCFAL
jgi:hypothetical protein